MILAAHALPDRVLEADSHEPGIDALPARRRQQELETGDVRAGRTTRRGCGGEVFVKNAELSLPKYYTP